MNLTALEELQYATVIVKATSSSSLIAQGTGFFMLFPVGDELGALVLMTSKNVIEGADTLTTLCHIADGDVPSGKSTVVSVSVKPKDVIYHPSDDVDLCAVKFSHVPAQYAAGGLPLFIRAFDASMIPSKEEWESYDVVEDIVMLTAARACSTTAATCQWFAKA